MKTTKQFAKEVTKLALPMALQMMVGNLATVINNVMIGSMGELNITAISIVGTYEFFDDMLCWATSDGTTILASQDHGRKENEKIKKLLSFTCLVNIAITVFFFLLIVFFPKTIIKVYTDIEGVVDPGIVYLRFVGYSLFFTCISSCVNAILNSIKSVKVGFYASVFGCILNVLLNYLFIEGRFGLPALGIYGAGMSILVSRIVSTLISVGYLLFIDKELDFKLSDFDPFIGKEELKRFVKVTYPLAITSFLQNLTSTVQTMIVGRISEYYIAANSIVHMSWLIPNVFCMGVASASSVYIGHEIGEGNLEDVKKDSYRFLAFGVIFGLFSALMVQVTLPILLMFYNVSAETITLAKQMSWSCMLIVFFNSNFMVSGEGVFRAAGDTRRQMVVDVLSTWLLAIPLGYLAAFIFKWPAYIIYIIVRAATIVKACWAAWQILKGDWMTYK